MLKPMKKKKLEYVRGVNMPKNFSTVPNDMYETPKDIFHFACDYFQVYPKLDVASTDENKLCEFNFTEKQNGLNQNWFFDSWMNCPYSNASQWIEKAYNENKKNNINIIALLNSTTDTIAWHEYILYDKAEIHFLKGRVRFNVNGLRSKHPSQHPSALICWRKFYA